MCFSFFSFFVFSVVSCAYLDTHPDTYLSGWPVPYWGWRLPRGLQQVKVVPPRGIPTAAVIFAANAPVIGGVLPDGGTDGAHVGAPHFAPEGSVCVAAQASVRRVSLRVATPESLERTGTPVTRRVGGLKVIDHKASDMGHHLLRKLHHVGWFVRSRALHTNAHRKVLQFWCHRHLCC